MKKTRFLALFLCLVMLLGFLPPRTRAANQLILTNPGFRHSQYFRVKNSTVGVMLTLDFDTMKATADFWRVGELEFDSQELGGRKPKEWGWIRMIQENTSGTVTYDIRPAARASGTVPSGI